MITVLPAATPVTTPVAASTVAIVGWLLLHVPPLGEQCSAVVAFTHIVVVPVITPGKQFIDTLVVVLQPVPKV